MANRCMDSMSETIYKYVKGKGWIPEANPVDYGDVASYSAVYGSHRVTILDRPPQVGERAWNVDFFDDNGTLNFPAIWLDIVNGRGVPLARPCGWVRDYVRTLSEGCRYVTVITEEL